MSRTAADVLSASATLPGAGAAGGAGAPGTTPGAGASANPGGTAGAGAGTAGAGGTGQPGAAQARADAFWNGWDKPEQKDVRDFVANKNYSDPYELAKSYRELERTRGHNVVPIPRDEYDQAGKLIKADDVGRAAWNKAMGVPDKPDDYGIKAPADSLYPEFSSEISKLLHANNIPARAARGLVDGWENVIAGLEAKARAQEDLASKAGVLELEREWGSSFRENAEIAARGADALAKISGDLSPDQMRAMERALGTTAYLKMMNAFGRANAEGRFAGGDTGGNQFKGGASEAQTRLDEITAQRASGAISDHKWREMQPELDSLRDRIVAGMASN